MISPNIFIPRNNWNVITLLSKKYIPTKRKDYVTLLVLNMARDIEMETGFNPLYDTDNHEAGICQARQLHMVMIRRHTNYTLKEVMGIFGKKDHSTVINAQKSIKNMCDTDKQFKAMFDRIDERISLLNKNTKL